MPPLRMPYGPMFAIGGRELRPRDVIERLGPYLSERRRQRIAEVVAARTYSVVPVLEGVHDLGNVHAVLRSAEGLGYAAAHLVALQGEAATWAAAGRRRARRQSQGADKWLDLHVWPDAASFAEAARSAGYRIAATQLSAAAVPIAELDFTQPTAIVFGNEAEGVSAAMREAADLEGVIPIDGFIQSYNISVAAAITLYQARQDRLARQGHHGDLDAVQRERLTAAYYLRAVRHAEALLAQQ